jgi:hypothetical protein
MPVIINGTDGINVASTTGVINLLGSTSGAITIAPPAVAGTNTLTLPAATGTVLSNTTTGVCQAWVTFTETTINASYNVSSVTLFATGRYTVTFTNALVDANYCVVCSVVNTVSSDYADITSISNASSFVIGTFSSNGTYITPGRAFAAVFR